MKVDVKKQFQGRSYRVKGIDLHPSEPWVVCSLFSGSVQLWNYETQSLLRSIEVSATPVRACRFIARKNWIVTGGDDMQIRIYNLNTFEKVTQFEAHADYIRALAVHPTQPLLLSGSDDLTVKLWNWDQNWRNVETFKSHQSYVMSVAFNPKDANTFASASMDRTVKVWSLSSPVPNFTLEAHETKGVNFVEYYPFADKPYLLTTSDDETIRIFDYQSKSCVATLSGHSSNVSFAIFHPEAPIIISGSEDSTIKIWNARSYKLEKTVNFGMERAWCIASLPTSSSIAIGFETGPLMLQFGSNEPAASMDSSGKLVWVKHLEAFSSVIKARPEADGTEEETALQLTAKDLGTVEMQPSQLVHSPNGRFVAVCGDGEYIVYTALAWRNKAFGSAVHFAWAPDSNAYAVARDDGTVTAFRNFTELPQDHFDIEFQATRLWGGALLAINGQGFVAFYDWESGRLVSQVDMDVQSVVWSDFGDLVTLTSEDEFYVLRFNRDLFAEALAVNENVEEGVEGAFEVVNEFTERVRSGRWIGDCFVYTSAANRLNYVVGSEIYNLTHYDRDMYLLGYLPRDNSLYLCDKDMRVHAQRLSLAVIEYQTVVLRGDLDYAAELLEKVPDAERSKVARFLEAQGLAELALQVTRDMDHRFDLALQLNNLQIAEEVAESQDSAAKWKSLGDKWLANWQMPRAESCYAKAGDLDTLLLVHTSTGNKAALSSLAAKAVDQGQYNLAFNAYWFIGDVDKAADLLNRSNRSAEAAMLSLTYGGDVQGNVEKWKAQLKESGREKIADLICEPAQDADRFPANVGGRLAVRPVEPLIDLINTPADTPEPKREVQPEPAQPEPAYEPEQAYESEPAYEPEPEQEPELEHNYNQTEQAEDYEEEQLEPEYEYEYEKSEQPAQHQPEEFDEQYDEQYQDPEQELDDPEFEDFGDEKYGFQNEKYGYDADDDLV
ncbi:Coatomer subunit beta' [Wickerhamiella sorbophila]|uniref:Coatomer subunit beta' n=1 Tax=Wickerhamiella sorbophila TaxID=45607 RepID=A0A2T0FGL1_9ASCO|nr:Coatomer subunit beta' [Wickerhamiella sorbophila]PRT54142.1 Coatomer subunit beta' [Wickerhamiella sorbophila]